MKLSSFAFDKAFPDAWRETGVKVRVLESLGRFEVRTHVKNRLLFKSLALVYTCIQEVIYVSEMSAVNFVVRWMLFAMFVKAVVQCLSVYVPPIAVRTVCLKVVIPVEMEIVFLQNESDHTSEEVSRNGRFI